MSIYILIGFVVFLLIHLVSIVPTLKESLVFKYGEKKFKASYALISALGFSLMLIARFNSGPSHKLINAFFYENIHGFMLIANILIVSAYIPNNHFKKWIQHPMLLGIFIWSFSHVMINNHLNHTLFFGSLAIFSIIMFIGLIKRDGVVKYRTELKFDLLCFLIGAISHGIIMYSHKYIAGVKII